MQGWRNTMEDSHIAAINLENKVQVFGVFDGHGGKIFNILNTYLLGKEVALYVKDKFIEELTKLQSYKQGDYYNALRESFIKIDEILKSP